ncbi:MAG TPA: pitrilysin family protein [Candidatus Babeliales bacterium]|nr:pitrilysin family protein [Candidatus Babeliales bacterium]
MLKTCSVFLFFSLLFGINIYLTASDAIIRHTLKNGLTVLIREKHDIPKVAVQIWYNVGSKDELLHEKGIAHLLEHMVFKGTHTLSETDHGAVVRKLSGTCNGITSADWTRYIYDLPSHNWRNILPIISDCMTNCTFSDDVLNSEMKAVIQELKMYNDNYGRSLRIELEKAIFADHPYHYPVIGYKKDLINITGKDLHAFYKKHYKPNNATLVVVGDVETDEVIDLANQYFGHIPHDEACIKKENSCIFDIVSKSVTLYRDIVHPSFIYAFAIPGLSKKNIFEISILEWIIGQGRGSRLYKKLVHDYGLATNVTTGSWSDLFEHGIFFIQVDPKNQKDKEKIEDVIDAELIELASNGLSDSEFKRALQKTQMRLYTLLENFNEQASRIGLMYLATKDENYGSTLSMQSSHELKQNTHDIIEQFFRPSVIHKGYLLPLSESEKNNWLTLQQASDQKDKEILSQRVRHTQVESALYAKRVNLQETMKPFAFPKAEKIILSNGLNVLHHHNGATPRIKITLNFKADSYYDPQDKQGLCKFVMAMMVEGTETYTAQELIDILDAHGISLIVSSEAISINLLESDLVFGLRMLNDILNKSTFPENKLEKVRQQLLVHVKKASDDLACCKDMVLKNILYKGHPYSKQANGNASSIGAISRADLLDFYKKYISPQEAHLVIVGDLHNYDIQEVVAQELGDWCGAVVEDIEYPPLFKVPTIEVNHQLNRDQAFICLAQLSIDRYHPDFDKYRIFDYIFSGGNFSRGSRLFSLREQTGIFYIVGGSLVSGAGKQPGVFQVTAIVSPDRLQEAEEMLKNLIDTVVDTVTQEEFEEAKRTIINNLVNNFVSNDALAATFLFLDRFKLPADYFDNRAASLETITLEDMKTAVKDILHSDKMITVRAGRV